MDTVPPPPPADIPATSGSTEDKTPAILAYITIIGFIVAIVMHNGKKTRLGAYHLRQALGIFITWFIGAIVFAIIPILGWMIMPFWMLCMLVLLVIGLIAAANGQMKPVPILGTHYQKWFGNAFD